MIEKPPQAIISANCFDLLRDKQVANLVKSINDSYLYWDKIKYKASPIKPEQLWELIKLTRKINFSSIVFENYSFNYAPTDYINKTLHYFDMHIGGYMGAKGVVPEADRTKYLVNSIMEEAISSSQMEGANTTRKKAKEMLRKEVKPKTKSEQMIVNNYLTIKYITQNKKNDLTVEELLYIHSLISNDTLDFKTEEGTFRSTNDIYIVNHSNSEVVHTPPNFTEISGLINSLCAFFNKDDDFIHPIIKGIIIHFMIGWIHPFTDGNGRTARALFYWYLLKKGYWLTEYLSISKAIQSTKNQYEKAYLYTETDDNDLTYFVTYNLKVMEKAFENLKNYIQLKQKELKTTYNFIKIENVNERQAQILQWVFKHAEIVFSIKEIENRFSVSNYTARTDLNGLVSLGFLETVRVNKIKQNFIKASSFDNLISKYVKH